jgi:hypothetical protein
MVNSVCPIKNIIAVGSVAVSLALFGGFAGVAAADPEVCSGGIGPGSDHQPFAVGKAARAACMASLDASVTGTGDDVSSWGVGDAVSSYPGHNVPMTASPQTKVP